MNIISDLTDTTEHSKVAKALMASWIDDVQYHYTTEYFNEVRRQKNPQLQSKLKRLLSQFEEVSADEEDVSEALKVIQKILPGDSKSKVSDQKQLAYSASASCDYFITRDEQILKKSREFKQLFDLEIVRPAEFILELDSENNYTSYKPLSLASLKCCKRRVNKADLNVLFDLFHGANERKTLFLNSLSSIISNKDASSFLYELDGQVSIFYCVIEESPNTYSIPFLRLRNNQGSTTLLFKVISTIVQDSIFSDFSTILVTDEVVLDDIEIQEALEAFGFTLSDDGYLKTSINEVFKSKSKLVNHISDGHNHMSTLLKKYCSYGLERIFWPAKITTPEIQTFVIPIEPHWAKELFDEHSASEDLFGACDSLIFSNKNIYYRSKSLCGLAPKSRILWYIKSKININQSGTLKAVSMLDEVEVGKPKALFKKHKNYGVYEWDHIFELCKKDIDNSIMAISFSNTEIFKSPVSYSEAKDLIESNGIPFNNFQQPIKIPENIFETVYKAGMGIK